MSLRARPDRDGSDPARPRRRYDSPLRRQRAAETRERILAAGSALVHSFPAWDWRGLTFGAVAERAGVGKRTVYRYERLITEWNLDGDQATRAITWVIGLLADAIRHDRRPGSETEHA